MTQEGAHVRGLTHRPWVVVGGRHCKGQQGALTVSEVKIKTWKDSAEGQVPRVLAGNTEGQSLEYSMAFCGAQQLLPGSRLLPPFQVPLDDELEPQTQGQRHDRCL